MSNEEEAYVAEAAYVAAMAEEYAAREAQSDADRHAYEEAQLRELAEGYYIGDGVYASFDGHHVWLKASRDGMEHSVALEPNVLNKLLNYVRHFYPTYGKDRP